MKHRMTMVIRAAIGIGVLIANSGILVRSPIQSARADEGGIADPKQRDDQSQSVTEARGRARLLHETVHGALHVMHRDFFREDEGLKIPSRSLDDVFAELHRSHGVKVRWLAVTAEPMNVDHGPKDDFETDAVKALASGKEEFDRVEGDSLRFVGLIPLPSQCLKCHLPRRTSTKDRAAGVVITIPFKKK